MRKHFLLLFLMALLPLSGWAQDIVIQAKDFTVKWGEIPAPNQVNANMFALFTSTTASKANIAATLTFEVIDEVTEVNTTTGYTYRITWNETQPDGDNKDVSITTATAKMFVEPKPIGELAAVGSLVIGDQVYTGNAVDPEFTITGLTRNVDYTVACENSAVGPATATISGNGNYSGSVNKDFTIKNGVANLEYQLTGVDNAVYTGSPIVPASIVLYAENGETPLTVNNDYTVAVTNNTNAGDAVVTFTGKGNYTGTKVVNFTIGQKSITENVTIDNIAPVVWAGSAATPALTVKWGTDVFDASNYDVSYTNNTGIGTATATVTGKGNYTGTVSKTFQITGYSIIGGDVTLGGVALNTATIADKTYTGDVIEPAIALKHGSTDLALNTDYTLTYGDATTNKNVNGADPATAFVTITGKGSYEGTKTITFNIVPAAIDVTAKDVSISYGADFVGAGVNYKLLNGTDELTGDVTYTIYDQGTTDVADKPYQVGGNYDIMPAGLANPNYDITFKPGTLTVVAGQITAEIKPQTVTFGTKFTTTGIQYRHKDGLSSTEAAAFDEGTGVTGGLSDFKIYEEDGVTEATPIAGKEYYPAGTYVVKATSTLAYPSNTIALLPGQWVVTPKAITDGMIAPLSKKYTGVAEAPSTTGKITFDDLTLVEGADKDYTVELVEKNGDADRDNMNAGSTTAMVKIKAVENGNYSGEVTKAFTINKATLTITAETDVEWTLGATEPPYNVTFSGLVGKDQGLDLKQAQAGFNGVLKAKRVCNTNIGEYTQGIKPYFEKVADGSELPAEDIADNYTITNESTVYGKLTIKKGTITLKAKDVEGVYGEAFAADGFEYVSGDDVNGPNFESFVDLGGAVIAVAEPEADDNNKYLVGKSYDINVTGVATATNYQIVLQKGTFTVAKRPLKLKAKEQNVNLANDDKFNTVASATTIDLVDATTIAATDNWADLNITLEPATFLIGVNDINIITTDGNNNYDFVVVTEGAGKLNLSGMPEVTFTNYSDVEYYGGKPVTAAKLDMNARDLVYRTSADEPVVAGGKTYEWPYQKEEWFGLVLPFEISVADLSRAFGYAIVNRLDDVELNSDNTLNIKFKIEMDMIPANEPFVLKTSKAVSEINGTGIIDFGTQTIVDPGTTTPYVEKNGYKFYGTYNDVQLTKDQTKWSFLAGGDWKKVSATSSNHYNLKAFDCYFDRGDAAAREFVFTFQDIDGTATAIRNVSADGESKSYAEGWYTIDGMKLNAAPAQKGIYINNGKKVVIK